MNPGAAIALIGFSLGIIAGCMVRWGVGPASSLADRNLADLDPEADEAVAVEPDELADDLMAIAAAVQDGRVDADMQTIVACDFALWELERGGAA